MRNASAKSGQQSMPPSEGGAILLRWVGCYVEDSGCVECLLYCKEADGCHEYDLGK